MIRHFSHIFFVEGLTFIAVLQNLDQTLGYTQPFAGWNACLTRPQPISTEEMAGKA